MFHNQLLLAEGELMQALFFGIAVLAGAGAVKLIDFLRRRDVEKEADLIVALTKEAILELVQKLPDDVTWDDAIYQLSVRKKIAEGIGQHEAGETLTHEEVKSRLAR